MSFQNKFRCKDRAGPETKGSIQGICTITYTIIPQFRYIIINDVAGGIKIDIIPGQKSRQLNACISEFSLLTPIEVSPEVAHSHNDTGHNIAGEAS